MRKAAASKGSAAPSPIPGSEPSGIAGGEPMRRAGSGGTQRAPSALSTRRDSPLPRNDGSSAPGTPIRVAGLSNRPQVSRNSSTSTAMHTAILPSGLGLAATKGPVLKPTAERRRLSSLPIATTPPPPEQDPSSPGPAESDSDTASSRSSPAQSRIVRRPPRFQGAGGAQQDGGPSLADEDDDDEAEPAFLPFKSQAASAGTATGRSSHATAADLGATLRGDHREELGRRLGKTGQHHGRAAERGGGTKTSQTSDSSASSAAPLGKAPAAAVDRRPHGPGPLSPRRAAELAGRSPGAKGKGYSREGSDGTPSMGSSFSDLDDASVTQSALEEALASKMQEGGTIGSRMSTISQAIRSRYLPKGGRPS